MFVVYYCEWSSVAPLTKYKNNEIIPERTKKDYFGDDSAQRLYIDVRRSKGYTNELERLTRNDGGATLTIKLKKAAQKKMRLRVIAYPQAEYCFTSTYKGYIMTKKL